jgi:hypothetical protein
VVSILFHISTSEAEVAKRKKERDGEREIGHVRYMRKNPLLPPGSKTHPSKKPLLSFRRQQCCSQNI